jgi:putative ABC transport system permease protein
MAPLLFLIWSLGEIMESLLHDARYALRVLRKSPGFAAAVILTLALAMGANTVMFSVLNTVLLRPLPYPHADRLVQIWETEPRRGSMRRTVSPYDFLEWKKASQTFAEIATYDYNPVVLSGLKTPQRLSAQFVSAGFFDVFRISPIKGRTFRSDEDQDANNRVVVLSFGAWSRYFDRDPNIVGKPVTLDDRVYTVIGIMPADFSFPHDSVEAWCLPGFEKDRIRRGSSFLFSVGRLKPEANLDQAQAEMSKIADNLNHQDGRTTGVYLVGLQEETVGHVRRRLLVLWAAVLAVLLIASANVAGLLLARAVSRQKEVAIRAALGGSRWRLVRQFLTESVLLAGLGGICGVALAYLAGRFVIAGANGAVPRLHDLRMDASVLGFTAFVCLATGVAFGIAPALHALRFDFQSSLKESGLATQGSGRLRLRSLLVAGELGLATVLLVAGGLLIKTLWRLEHVDAGFQTENILTFRFSVPDRKYTPRQRADLYQQLLDRLAEIPGVAAAGGTNGLPFAGSRTTSSFEIAGHPLAPGQEISADRRTVSPGYMQAMRIRLVAGREFTRDDGPYAPPVAIVNQAFVKKFLPGEDPLAQKLHYSRLYQIIGVVADVKHENLAAPGDPEVYIPYAQSDPPNWTFVVLRTQGDIQALPASVRSAVQEIAPGQPIYRLDTMSHLVDYSISRQKFSSWLLAIFAGLALLLASIGIYGLITYSVVQRTREIGIRMALGADRAKVVQLILRQGVWIGVLGFATGTGAAWLSTRALASMLFGVEPHDPPIFFTVLAALILVLALASYIPARRATRVDPLVALRSE